jgi:hypothetical protein
MWLVFSQKSFLHCISLTCDWFDVAEFQMWFLGELLDAVFDGIDFVELIIFVSRIQVELVFLDPVLKSIK